ncbi:hypothetical protein APUTEX25_004760 [Auxenochlorella protothecoides]|uniref:Uncharacterized protein n=1 Tax=Auxenochlorella protothecoides TaxID=3075 RepID=A0A3M7L524_AUXPR|nr:hypothetical protein APUTEX25_004760 [Auxenochlorella protothecoides]|eukprot:RMZ56596.1 hypothetical protein APUTEX25_004760 [Auxenochlorella protothecoides]
MLSLYSSAPTRFSLLLLQEGEEYVHEFVAECAWPPQIPGNWQGRPVLAGHLRLATRSMFFDPDDLRVPIVSHASIPSPSPSLHHRLPFEGVEGLEAVGSARSGDFLVQSRHAVRMRPGAADVPYAHDRSRPALAWRFCLAFAAMHDFMPQAQAGSEWVRGATAAWQRGALSNFDYLLFCNLAAGRSFSDLAQYPVFPWVLADYASEALDLDKPGAFRDLTKPVGALNPARLAAARARYADMRDCTDDPPFLYGTHYSCPSYVLYWLVRAAPGHMLRLQGGRFDAPDRLFASVAGAWTSALANPADVKELIPEFYLPGAAGFLRNGLGLALGTRQDGRPVGDVELPPWARGSPERFLSLQRAALEAPVVSANLHHWLDLVFGWKQRGAAALQAGNVFRHLTYEGAVDLEAMEKQNPGEAALLRLQIEEYGQTPRQLFDAPHPRRLVAPRAWDANGETPATSDGMAGLCLSLMASVLAAREEEGARAEPFTDDSQLALLDALDLVPGSVGVVEGGDGAEDLGLRGGTAPSDTQDQHPASPVPPPLARAPGVSAQWPPAPAPAGVEPAPSPDPRARLGAFNAVSARLGSLRAAALDAAAASRPSSMFRGLFDRRASVEAEAAGVAAQGSPATPSESGAEPAESQQRAAAGAAQSAGRVQSAEETGPSTAAGPTGRPKSVQPVGPKRVSSPEDAPLHQTPLVWKGRRHGAAASAAPPSSSGSASPLSSLDSDSEEDGGPGMVAETEAPAPAALAPWWDDLVTLAVPPGLASPHASPQASPRPRDAKVLHRLTFGPAHGVTALAVAAGDGARNGTPTAFAATQSGQIRAVELESGKQVRCASLSAQPLTCLALARPDPRGHPLALAGGYDGEVRAYCARTGCSAGGWVPGDDAVSALCTLGSGVVVATASGGLAAWETGGGRHPWRPVGRSLGGGGAVLPLLDLEGLQGEGAWSLAALPAGSHPGPLILAGTEAGAVLGWDPRRGGAPAWRSVLGQDIVAGLSVDAGSAPRVSAAAADGRLRLLDLRRGGAVMASAALGSPLLCAACPGPGWTAAGDEEGAAWLWRAPGGGRPARAWRGEAGDALNALALGPPGPDGSPRVALFGTEGGSLLSWITLLEKTLSFDIKEVDLENKSDEFKAKYASLHPGPDAPAKVPILDDADGTALFESLVVAYYLNDKYPEPALLPSEAAAKAKISLFIELFPPSIFSNAFSLVKAETRAQVAERLPALVQGLKTANALLTSLGSSEGGDYFAGAQYTLADIATSPLYHRAVHLLKGHRDIDIPAILQEHKLDRLAAWSKAVLERPSFQETAPDAEVVIKSMAKTHIVLLEKNLEFGNKIVDLTNKSDEFKAKYGSVHPVPGASAKIPILEDVDGTTLIESWTIMHYLEYKYPETPLLPKGAAERAKIELFVQLQGASLFERSSAILKARTQAELAVAKAGFVDALKVRPDAALRTLGSQDGGDYFAGGQYTLADIAASTRIYRPIVLVEDHFGMDVQRLINEHRLDRLKAWLKAIFERPTFKASIPSRAAMSEKMGKHVVPLDG